MMAEQQTAGVTTAIGFDAWRALEAQVTQLAQTESRRADLLQKHIAREALIDIVAAQAADEQTFSFDVRGGFAANYRLRDLLGLLDLTINGHLVAAYAAPPAAHSIWLTQAQVEAQSAPDIWAVLAISGSGNQISAELLGWHSSADLLALPADNNGLREVHRAGLRSPDSLFEFLRQQAARRPLLAPDPAIRAQLEAELVGAHASLSPLAQLRPAVFDCLVSEVALAEAYVGALRAARHTRARVVAPPEWAYPTPQNVAVQALELARAGRAAQALALLRAAGDPDLLQLRALLNSLVGNLRAALDDAREAYRLAPGRALSLFAPVPRPQLALAWQYIPQAALAGGHTEIIDAADASNELLDDAAQANLDAADGQLIFSLGAQLPPRYAGYHYRVFVVDAELRAALGLTARAEFRAAFAQSAAPATEQQHLIASTTLVLTAQGDLLEGSVGEDALLDIWEPVAEIGRAPEEYFRNKTVVVLLYREAGADDAE